MMMHRIHPTLSFGLVVGLVSAASVGTAAAETVTTTKTTTYVGTVSEVNPATSTIILKSDASPDPVTYTYSKETTFVDSTGKVVSSETIRNSPVTVEYGTEGGKTVVRRVIQTAPGAYVTPPVPAAPAVPAGVIREKSTTRTETTD